MATGLPAPQPTAGRRIAPEAWIALAAFAFGALTYANTIHGDFVFDDISLIVNNDIIKDPRRISEVLFTDLWGLLGRTSNYYRPFPPLLFMGLHALFGMRPEPFHTVSIALHALSTSLVFLMTSALLAKAGISQDRARWSALAGAALFAAHPIHTEAVAWISGVMDVSCTAFSLLAVCLYIAGDEGGLRRTVLSPASLLLALFSKEPAAVVPFVLIGYDVLFCRERIAKPADAFRRWAPAFAVLTAYLCLRTVALGGLAPYDRPDPGWSVQAVLTLPRLLALYIQKLVAPVGLNAVYGLKPIETLASPELLKSLAVLSAFGAVAAVALKAGTVAAFGLLLLVLPLMPSLYVPALSLDLSNAFAERYLYFPSVGAAVLVAAAIAAVGERSRRLYLGMLTLVVAAVAVLTSMTISRSVVWHDSLALWSDSVRKSPDVAAAHENLGLTLIRRGRECEGRRELRTALRLAPELAGNSMKTGVLAARKGLTMQAILSFQTALLYDPDLVDARYNLALAFEQLGWTEAAIEQYRATLAGSSDRVDAHNNLGILLAQVGLVDEAIDHFRAAVLTRPDDPELRLNLARAYEMKGLADEAADQRALAQRRPQAPIEMRSSHPSPRP